MRQEKISFLSMLPIRHTLFLVRIIGGVIIGIHFHMDVFLMKRNDFFHNFSYFSTRFRNLPSSDQIMRIPSTLTSVLTVKTVTSLSKVVIMRIVCMDIGSKSVTIVSMFLFAMNARVRTKFRIVSDASIYSIRITVIIAKTLFF